MTDWKKFFSVGVSEYKGYCLEFNSNEITLTKYGILDFLIGYNINDNIWHHLVAIYNTTEMYLFLDENLITSNSNSLNTYPTTSDNSYIGREIGDSYFKGLIDEVMIFKRAISIDEIKSLYNNFNKSYYSSIIIQKGINKIDVSSCNLKEGEKYSLIISTKNGVLENYFIAK